MKGRTAIIYVTGMDGREPDGLFVVETNCFRDLCANLVQPCACSGRWKLQSMKQVSTCSIFVRRLYY